MAAGVKCLDIKFDCSPRGPVANQILRGGRGSAQKELPAAAVSTNRCAQASHEPGARRNLPKQRGQYHLVYTYAPPGVVATPVADMRTAVNTSKSLKESAANPDG